MKQQIHTHTRTYSHTYNAKIPVWKKGNKKVNKNKIKVEFCLLLLFIHEPFEDP